ncbi:MAG TPA: LptF/LptG family permease [Phycisphaerales bacterium]|nr:LptF/LptG family permease [Phycisphaerales bacterium]
MVFTLQRYVFRELFKVFLLSSIGLTLILSLGSILQPVQKYGVGPGQVLHLMGYFLPVTLTFVLPMAALFACSLVYGRFASDNELDACRASGVHMMTVVYPGLTLAIVVTIATLLLSFHVTPAFVHRAEKSFKDDARQILFRNIQRRGYYALPPDQRNIIYADQVSPAQSTLSGVVLVRLAKQSANVERVVAAEAAHIAFNPHEQFNEVEVKAHNTFQIDSQDESGAGADWLSLTFEFGSLLADEIKFKRLDEMKRIRINPIEFHPVARLSRDIYVQTIAELLAQDIRNTLDAGRSYRLHSGSEIIEFTASRCEPRQDRRIELLGDIVVDQYEADTPPRKTASITSAKAFLHLEGDELWPTLTLDVYNARLNDSAFLKMRHFIRSLVLPTSIENTMARFKTEDNRLAPATLKENIPGLTEGMTRDLERRKLQLAIIMDKAMLEVKSELHSRLVFGLGCVPMILIGIGLGIVKRGGHLLSAFGVSCLPAAMLIICIMSGKQIIENVKTQVSGTLVMWGGLGVLCFFVLAIYARLFRT